MKAREPRSYEQPLEPAPPVALATSAPVLRRARSSSPEAHGAPEPEHAPAFSFGDAINSGIVMRQAEERAVPPAHEPAAAIATQAASGATAGATGRGGGHLVMTSPPPRGHLGAAALLRELTPTPADYERTFGRGGPARPGPAAVPGQAGPSTPITATAEQDDHGSVSVTVSGTGRLLSGGQIVIDGLNPNGNSEPRAQGVLRLWQQGDTQLRAVIDGDPSLGLSAEAGVQSRPGPVQAVGNAGASARIGAGGASAEATLTAGVRVRIAGVLRATATAGVTGGVEARPGAEPEYSVTPVLRFTIGEDAREEGGGGDEQPAGQVQRAADGGEADIQHDAGAALRHASGGAAGVLPHDLRQRFEGSLGTDLSGVRVHTDGAAATAAESFGALAFAHGQDVYFGAGQYNPGTATGDHLIAHEVAHTVQQRGATVGLQTKLEVSTPGDASEMEADRAADAMLAGASSTVSLVSTAGRIARQVGIGSIRYSYTGTFEGGGVPDQNAQTQAVNARTVPEWMAFLRAATNRSALMEIYGFMALALGRRANPRPPNPNRGPGPYGDTVRPTGRSVMPYEGLEDFRLTGATPTQDQCSDLVIAMLSLGSHLDIADDHELLASVMPDFMGRYHGPALERNTTAQGSLRGRMDLRDVNAVSGAVGVMSHVSAGTAPQIIASALATATAAAVRYINHADPLQLTLIANGAATICGTVDQIQAQEQAEAVAHAQQMTAAFSVALAALAPLASGLAVSAQVVAAGMSAAATAWFTTLFQPSPVADKKRGLNDRIGMRIDAYGHEHQASDETCEMLKNRFHDSLG